MEREAVILAGGLGTRLRDILGDIPKPMAPVGGKPFLEIILEQLCRNRVKRVVMAVSYRYEDIISFFGNSYKDLELIYSVEEEPLGTGGAILRAAESIVSDSFLTVNGDTFFNIDLENFRRTFKFSNASLSIALKPMSGFDRYGSVSLAENRIVSFNEKTWCEKGMINGGIYMIRKGWLMENAPSAKFSFEKDILEKRVDVDIFTGYVSDSYFIDIGIPEDYDRAGRELPSIFFL